MVTSIAIQVEKRLQQEGRHGEYNEEIHGYLKSGAFVELSEKEMKEYEGPVNYVGHHGVYKRGSTSTKCRVVENPSVDNNNQGLSQNDR